MPRLEGIKETNSYVNEFSRKASEVNLVGLKLIFRIFYCNNILMKEVE